MADSEIKPDPDAVKIEPDAEVKVEAGTESVARVRDAFENVFQKTLAKGDTW